MIAELLRRLRSERQTGTVSGTLVDSELTVEIELRVARKIDREERDDHSVAVAARLESLKWLPKCCHIVEKRHRFGGAKSLDNCQYPIVAARLAVPVWGASGPSVEFVCARHESHYRVAKGTIAVLAIPSRQLEEFKARLQREAAVREAARRAATCTECGYEDNTHRPARAAGPGVFVRSRIEPAQAACSKWVRS